MPIDTNYSNYQSPYPQDPNQVSQNWNLQSLFAYFMSWFQQNSQSTSHQSPYAQANYNLSMQNQWNSLYQAPDTPSTVESQLDSQITIAQTKMNQYDNEIGLIDGDAATKGTLDRIGQDIENPPHSGEGRGIFGFMSGFISGDEQEKTADLMDKYSYVYKDKVPVDGNGKPVPGSYAKALYYVREFLRNRRNEAQADRDALLGQRDGTTTPIDE